MSRDTFTLEKTDNDWISRTREDYQEDTSNMTDEEVRDHYANGQKYVTLWDNVGEAYYDYEKLADAYLALINKLKK